MGQCKKGAKDSCVAENPANELKPRRQDFTVKIIFSSMSYSTYTNWARVNIGDKSKPYTSEHSVMLEAWPGNDGYVCDADEVIFIDCGSQKAKKFKRDDYGNKDLTVYLSWAINRLKELMYRKSKKGIYGFVNCYLMAVHPCEKCIFALSRLLGSSTQYDYLYASFIGEILSKPEFKYAFNWIQAYGWMFNVNYCGVFDPYESSLDDMKGREDRAKEMEEVLTKPGWAKNIIIGSMLAVPTGGASAFSIGEWHEDDVRDWVNEDKDKRRFNPDNGNIEVKYNNKWIDYDELEQEYEKMTNPSTKDLENSLREAKKNRDRIETKTKSLEREIDRAEADATDGVWNEITNNDIEFLKGTDKYRGKDSSEIRDELAKDGLSPTKKRYTKEPIMVVQVSPYTGELEYLTGTKRGVSYHERLLHVQGQYVTKERAQKIQKAQEKELKKAEDTVTSIEDAIKAKNAIIGGLGLDALQFVIGILGIACPALYLLDIAITIGRWVVSENNNYVMGSVGIAFDIASLIPYFGTVFRMVKATKAAAAAAQQTAELSSKVLKATDGIADVAKTTDKIVNATADAAEVVNATDKVANATVEAAEVLTTTDRVANATAGATEVATTTEKVVNTTAEVTEVSATVAETSSKVANATESFGGEIVGISRAGSKHQLKNSTRYGVNTGNKDRINQTLDNFKRSTKKKQYNPDEEIDVSIKDPTTGEVTTSKMKIKDVDEIMKNNGGKIPSKPSEAPKKAPEKQPTKAENKPSDNKTNTNENKNNTSDNKASENKTSENKTNENNTSENKTSENKTNENNTSENNTSENKASENKTSENKTNENNTSENKTNENNTNDNKANENNSDIEAVDISNEPIVGHADSLEAATAKEGGDPTFSVLATNTFDIFKANVKEILWPGFKKGGQGLLEGLQGGSHGKVPFYEDVATLLGPWGVLFLGYNGIALATSVVNNKKKVDEREGLNEVNGVVKEYEPQKVDAQKELENANEDIKLAQQRKKQATTADEWNDADAMEKHAQSRKAAAQGVLNAREEQARYEELAPTQQEINALEADLRDKRLQEKVATDNLNFWNNTTPQNELDKINNGKRSPFDVDTLNFLNGQEKFKPGYTNSIAQGYYDEKHNNAEEAQQNLDDEQYLVYEAFVAQAESQSAETNLSNELFEKNNPS